MGSKRMFSIRRKFRAIVCSLFMGLSVCQSPADAQSGGRQWQDADLRLDLRSGFVSTVQAYSHSIAIVGPPGARGLELELNAGSYTGAVCAKAMIAFALASSAFRTPCVP